MWLKRQQMRSGLAGWALLFSLLSPFHCHTAVGADKTVTIVSDFFPPFFQQPGNAQPGYVVELLQQIASSKGWHLRYQISSGARYLRSIQDGSLQCAGEMLTEPRAELRYSSQTFGQDRLMFFVRPDSNWQFDGSENSLQQVRIGLISGYVYPEPIASYATNSVNAARVQWIQDDEPQMINLRKLHQHRIDALLDSENSLRVLANQTPIPLKTAGSVGPVFWMHIACLRQHKDSEQWLQMFDDGIKTLRQNGQLQAVLARYGVSDWQPH